MRNLRGAINLLCPLSLPEEYQLIAVTSWSSKHRTLLLTVNLARSIAALGRDVVVIDACPRAARDSTRDFSAGASIVDVITGAAHDMEPVTFDGVPVLRLESDDPALMDAIEFDDPRLLKRLNALRARRHVLIAISGLGGSPGPRALARHADAVLLCVKAGETTSQQVEASLKMLKSVRANTIGLLLDGAAS